MSVSRSWRACWPATTSARRLTFKGIAEGVENSNFYLQTERGSFILTLYEKRVQAGDLPFFLGLLEHLAARGIACPLPVRSDGAQSARSTAAPRRILTFLNGFSLRRPEAAHCAAAGAALARLACGRRRILRCRGPTRSASAGWRELVASHAAAPTAVERAWAT